MLRTQVYSHSLCGKAHEETGKKNEDLVCMGRHSETKEPLVVCVLDGLSEGGGAGAPRIIQTYLGTNFLPKLDSFFSKQGIGILEEDHQEFMKMWSKV